MKGNGIEAWKYFGGYAGIRFCCKDWNTQASNFHAISSPEVRSISSSEKANRRTPLGARRL